MSALQWLLGLRFTPNGEGVSVSGRERVIIEDTLTGTARATIPGDLGDPVAFSPDGQLVAVGIHKTMDDGPPGGSYQSLGLRLAELASGEEILHIDGRFEFAAFSPDGRTLLIADADGLRLWDVRTGEALLQRTWPVGSVRRPRLTAINSLAFLPDGHAVVTGMNDGTLLVWDLTQATRPRAKAAPALDRAKLDALWSDLAGNARKAYRASHTLAASPAQRCPSLRSMCGRSPRSRRSAWTSCSPISIANSSRCATRR